uniref:Uncharacterized protein n=1 Tax=Bionectria ochroleuca TaxID=29856 RepID=A0A8H7NDQ6_BIOOC
MPFQPSVISSQAGRGRLDVIGTHPLHHSGRALVHSTSQGGGPARPGISQGGSRARNNLHSVACRVLSSPPLSTSPGQRVVAAREPGTFFLGKETLEILLVH